MRRSTLFRLAVIASLAVTPPALAQEAATAMLREQMTTIEDILAASELPEDWEEIVARASKQMPEDPYGEFVEEWRSIANQDDLATTNADMLIRQTLALGDSMTLDGDIAQKLGKLDDLWRQRFDLANQLYDLATEETADGVLRWAVVRRQVQQLDQQIRTVTRDTGDGGRGSGDETTETVENDGTPKREARKPRRDQPVEGRDPLIDEAVNRIIEEWPIGIYDLGANVTGDGFIAENKRVGPLDPVPYDALQGRWGQNYEAVEISDGQRRGIGLRLTLAMVAVEKDAPAADKISAMRDYFAFWIRSHGGSGDKADLIADDVLLGSFETAQNTFFAYELLTGIVGKTPSKTLQDAIKAERARLAEVKRSGDDPMGDLLEPLVPEGSGDDPMGELLEPLVPEGSGDDPMNELLEPLVPEGSANDPMGELLEPLVPDGSANDPMGELLEPLVPDGSANDPMGELLEPLVPDSAAIDTGDPVADALIGEYFQLYGIPGQ